MLTSIIFSLLGIIASYIFAKWQMTKNKIVHFSINSYDIGKGLSDEFPDFKLLFGEDVLVDNVMVLKGGFMNTGKNDINSFKGENDIKLILPDECKIKAFTLFPSTEDLVVVANTSNGKDNILNFGISEIFKSDEYFRYTAIIETGTEIKSLHNKLKFSHRISNTDKIKNTCIGLQRNQFRKKYFKIMISIIVLMSLLMTGAFSYQNLRYTIYNNTSNQKVKIHIDPYSNLYVNEGITIPFISGTKISSDELEKEYRIVPITEFKLNSLDSIVFISFLIISFIYIIMLYFLIWGKNGHIVNILDNEEIKKTR
ncbi:MAG: hypothetical protein IKY27_06070 [Bacteroidales bacterium]|nr:hypothetical protein [Bacteroidales bacterium]